MFNRYSLVILFSASLAGVSYADTQSLKIVGYNESALVFDKYNEDFGGWGDVQYRSEKYGFSMYSLPKKLEGFEEGVVANSDINRLSADKKYVVVQRTNAAEMVDGDGNKIVSSQAYCDMISLETGCIENIGSVQQCDGQWIDNKWKSTRGEFFEFSKGGVPPRKLLSEAVGLTEKDSRANSLKDSLFMGVSSYFTCYPPGKNISEYNDIAFYLAQGGEHLLAMQIYNYLLPIAEDRIPLKLNAADSLWALGRHEDAKSYYAKYRDAMIKKGLGDKVPERVVGRLN
ncbi:MULTISPECIES: hypothetical protein [unclassified Pseudomonas]|uniref:hypothetical protein n=1 Tax=unclassified Pseudomonas TaxID=196821 RepID=UPI000A1E21D7|nr:MULTISPECIES: hypothetical protein [unclassified Pseudomonas]